MRAVRVKRDEHLEEEDTRRPEESQEPSVMLNHCSRCRRYRYVYCLSGPFAYLCGRCRRELKEAR